MTKDEILNLKVGDELFYSDDNHSTHEQIQGINMNCTRPDWGITDHIVVAVNHCSGNRYRATRHPSWLDGPKWELWTGSKIQIEKLEKAKMMNKKEALKERAERMQKELDGIKSEIADMGNDNGRDDETQRRIDGVLSHMTVGHVEGTLGVTSLNGSGLYIECVYSNAVSLTVYSDLEGEDARRVTEADFTIITDAEASDLELGDIFVCDDESLHLDAIEIVVKRNSDGESFECAYMEGSGALDFVNRESHETGIIFRRKDV